MRKKLSFDEKQKEREKKDAFILSQVREWVHLLPLERQRKFLRAKSKEEVSRNIFVAFIIYFLDAKRILEESGIPRPHREMVLTKMKKIAVQMNRPDVE